MSTPPLRASRSAASAPAPKASMLTRTVRHTLPLATSLALAVSALSACSPSAPASEEVRPVRIMTLGEAAQNNTLEFAGEVRPRIESRLGFRVAGKIAARLVDVGALVKKGQPLAKLDPQDYALAQSAARAQAVAAQTDRDLASADLKRYTDLYNKGFISQAELERRQAVYKAAQAKLEQAQASYQGQANQTAYTTLVADADGVVTGLEAEVGQVVAAGQVVARVAQSQGVGGEKEVVIALPESRVDALRRQTEVKVRLAGLENAGVLAGRVRELAPAADAVTRTYAAKVTLLQPPPQVRLGMTATVIYPETVAGQAASSVLKVPLTALVQEKGRTLVWLFDPKTSTVQPQAVQVGEAVGNDIIITQGLRNGQSVVTAGAHLLKPGLKAKPLTTQVDLSGIAAASAASTATAPAAASAASQASH